VIITTGLQRVIEIALRAGMREALLSRFITAEAIVNGSPQLRQQRVCAGACFRWKKRCGLESWQVAGFTWRDYTKITQKSNLQISLKAAFVVYN
jgi:hypothetical protein